MFSFWGEAGKNSCRYFEGLSEQFLRIEKSPILFDANDSFHIHLGQSPNPSFFPYENALYDENTHRLYAVQGYLWAGRSLPTKLSQTAEAVKEFGDELLSRKTLAVNPEHGGIFILTVVDYFSRTMMITSDYSGIMPLYYSLSPSGSLLFSTHIIPLAKVIDAPIDEVGVIQQTAFHHTIGSRTLFKQISRLNAGETLIYSPDSASLSFAQATEFYSQQVEFKSDNEAADALWDVFLQGVRPLASIPGKKGVFLSGGLDTRLVVCGFKNFNSDITAITFGDDDNFEVEVAKKVGRKISAEQTVYPPVKDHIFNTSIIDQLITNIEYLNFIPYKNGTIHISHKGGTSASTGYGGETYLGGTGYALIGREWNQKNRFFNALQRSLGLPNAFFQAQPPNITNLAKQISDYYLSLLNSKRIMTDPWIERTGQAIEGTQNDVEMEIERFMVSNPQDSFQILERFWLEHHVLKQFGHQELTIMSILPLTLPTVFPAFMKLCSNLQPVRKADHGIYLKLAQRHFGELSKIPTGNIPISLMHPQLVLWLSRAWRARKDQNSLKLMMENQGRSTDKRFGWPNFEVWLRKSSFLDNCLEFISPEIYSHKLISKQIEQMKLWKKRVYSGQDFMTMITISQVINQK